MNEYKMEMELEAEKAGRPSGTVTITINEYIQLREKAQAYDRLKKQKAQPA